MERPNNLYFLFATSVLTSIVTQGRHDSAEWVKTYYVTCSLNGLNFVSAIMVYFTTFGYLVVTSAVIAHIFVDKIGAVFRILSSFYNSDQFNLNN